MKKKPVAETISDWGHQKILYKCAVCGQSFRMFGTKEKFCHNCGTEVDWDNVITSLKIPFMGNYEEMKELLKYVELRNRSRLR